MCLYNLCGRTKVTVLKRYGQWLAGKSILENFTNGLFNLKKEGFFPVSQNYADHDASTVKEREEKENIKHIN